MKEISRDSIYYAEDDIAVANADAADATETAVVVHSGGGDGGSHSNSSYNNISSSDGAGEHEPAGTRRQVGGAAVAGGIAGLLVAGPFVGLVAAGGAAAIATSRRGKAGQVARSTGDVVSDAGCRLQKFDQKHRVVEKTSNGIMKGCRWVSYKMKQPEISTQRRRALSHDLV